MILFCGCLSVPGTRRLAILRRRRQQVELGLVEKAPFAFGDSQRFESQAANRRAVQRCTMVARSGQHALDLMVFPLLEYDFKQVFAALHARQGCQRGRLRRAA